MAIPEGATERVKGWIMQRVVQNAESGCWDWSCFLDAKGYGNLTLKYNGVMLPRRAHRLAFEVFNGVIPHGLVVHHVCNNRKCVNPAHLEAVTNKQNLEESDSVLSMINRRKTHCKLGHPLSGENLGRHAVGGHRFCKTCKADWQRRSRSKP